MDVLFILLVVLIVGYLITIYFEGHVMAGPADLQRLIENMKRANGIVQRAADDNVKHGVIMDSFEQRLALNDESMGKISAYEKLMAEMAAMGDNGGPSLDSTFPPTSPVTSQTSPTYHTSSSSIGMFNH